MSRPSRQLNFPVNAKLPSDLRRDFCKLVYIQESKISDELREAIYEYVLKRQWMLTAREAWKIVLED